MSYWLFKEEPEHYNYADLERDGETLWSGVRNPLARQNLSQVKRGERIFYYHTGKKKAGAGGVEAVDNPMPDPNDSDPKAVVVKVKPVRRLPHPVTLKQIKEDPKLAQWDLVRLSRLSIVPVSDAQWRRVLEMSQGR